MPKTFTSEKAVPSRELPLAAAPRKAATIADVARAAGVAKSTASTALNGKGRMSPATRRAILSVARRLGFEANPHAQHLSSGRSDDTIGLFSLDLDMDVGTRKIKIIHRLLVAEGFNVPVYSLSTTDSTTEHGDDRQQTALMNSLRRQRPRAIVCANEALLPATLNELRRYADEGGHVVCYDLDTGSPHDCVVFDREANTYCAARHLLELGHRELGLYIGGPDRPRQPRRLGFERALQEFGVRPRHDWLFSGGVYEIGGAMAAERFLALKDRPTAMCIVNDYAALAFVARLHRAGVRVPEDVSIVSHDDAPIAEFAQVPLTTVAHPVDAIARAVADLLLSRLSNSYSGPPRRLFLRGDLVLRESSAPPRRSSN